MATSETARVGRHGTVVLPPRLRQRFGMNPGSTVLMETTENGILVRPAVVLPLEAYSPQRQAEFLLNNAVDLEDYRYAVREVRGLGIEPDDVPHERPTRY
jgi:AbrB family looped-hinge helix DNA binding protein